MFQKNNFLSEPFNYDNDFNYSIQNPSSFWDEVSKKYIHWDKPYESVLSENGNNKMNKYEWFKGGMLNACFNVLDRNIINGRGDEIAFIHETPLEGLSSSITYKELYDKVTRFSRSLKNLGIKKGDVILIYMHNSIETIIAMLSSIRIGAIHNVLFGGYHPNVISEVIDSCKPSLIITTNHGYVFGSIYHFSKNIKDSLLLSNHKPNHFIEFKRNSFNGNTNNEKEQSGIDNNINITDWNELSNESIEPLIEYELVESNHPLFITYSSGTTNKPKALTKNTSAIVSLAYSDRNNFELKQGDTYFSLANFGWVTGPYVIIYGCLLFGAKSIFCEGSFSNGVINKVDQYWNIIEKYKVSSLTITPAMIRNLIKNDPNGETASKYNLESVRKVSITSEKAHQTLIDYLLNKIYKRSIINSEFGQTESGILMTSNPSLLFPVRDDSIGKPTPSYNLKIVSKSPETDEIIEHQSNEIGNIVIKLPLPPSSTFSLYDDDSNSTLFNKYYLLDYPGYFNTGDMGYYDSDGYFYYVSRSGDYITVSGHTLNCTIVENEILKHSSINDCSVIGLNDEIMGQVPIAILVLQSNDDNNNNNNNNFNNNNDFIEKLKNELNEIINSNISSRALLKSIIIVNSLPKNKTGKKIKSILTQIFNNENFNIPPSIQDETIIDELLKVYNDNKFRF